MTSTVYQTVANTIAKLPSPMEAVQIADTTLRATCKLGFATAGAGIGVFYGHYWVKTAIEECYGSAVTLGEIAVGAAEAAGTATVRYAPQALAAARAGLMSSPYVFFPLAAIASGLAGYAVYRAGTVLQAALQETPPEAPLDMPAAQAGWDHAMAA